VEKFCTKYNISMLQHKLPREDEGQKSLYRHLLVYDKTETLFCFVPKTGCTNLRILFFLVQGKDIVLNSSKDINGLGIISTMIVWPSVGKSTTCNLILQNICSN